MRSCDGERRTSVGSLFYSDEFQACERRVTEIHAGDLQQDPAMTTAPPPPDGDNGSTTPDGDNSSIPLTAKLRSSSQRLLFCLAPSSGDRFREDLEQIYFVLAWVKVVDFTMVNALPPISGSPQLRRWARGGRGRRDQHHSVGETWSDAAINPVSQFEVGSPTSSVQPGEDRGM